MEQLSRTHVLYDLWVTDAALLDQPELWQRLLQSAAQESGATVICAQMHQFSPHGLTGFLLLAESHISVHTWPEEGLATLDVFTCGPIDIELIIDRVRHCLHPCRERVRRIKRGLAERNTE